MVLVMFDIIMEDTLEDVVVHLLHYISVAAQCILGQLHVQEDEDADAVTAPINRRTRLTKQDTNYRKAFKPAVKLAVTLHLATGNIYKSLQYGFRVAHNTTSVFIPEVCRAIVDELSKEVIACPTSPEGWKEVPDLFQHCWNFPHCIGAVDGKHIAIRRPANSLHDGLLDGWIAGWMYWLAYLMLTPFQMMTNLLNTSL